MKCHLLFVKINLFRYWSSKREDCRTYSGRIMMDAPGVVAKQILCAWTNRRVQFAPTIARTRDQLIAVLVSSWLSLVLTSMSQFSTHGMRSPTFNSILFTGCTPTSRVHWQVNTANSSRNVFFVGTFMGCYSFNLFFFANFCFSLGDVY